MPARWINGEATPPLASHDWYGFDLDHALCRYRVPALMELIYNCLVAGLIELHAYPAEALAQPWDMRKLQKGVIADFHTGDLLKLDGEGCIVRAFHGTRQLSAEEVASKYGVGAWPGFGLLKQRKRHRSFFDLLTYFDSPCQGVVQQMVDLVDAQAAATAAAGASAPPVTSGGHPTGATATNYDEVAIEPRYRRIRDDLIDVFNHIFDNVQAWDSGRGGFFGAIRSDPYKYLCPRPHLKRVLQRLRADAANPKRVFLATNSHLRFAEMTLTAVLGADWRDCFDLIVFNAAKPAFFEVTAPCLEADWTTGTDGATIMQLHVTLPRVLRPAPASLSPCKWPRPLELTRCCSRTVQVLADTDRWWARNRETVIAKATATAVTHLVEGDAGTAGSGVQGAAAAAVVTNDPALDATGAAAASSAFGTVTLTCALDASGVITDLHVTDCGASAASPTGGVVTRHRLTRAPRHVAVPGAPAPLLNAASVGSSMEGGAAVGSSAAAAAAAAADGLSSDDDDDDTASVVSAAATAPQTLALLDALETDAPEHLQAIAEAEAAGGVVVGSQKPESVLATLVEAAAGADVSLVACSPAAPASSSPTDASSSPTDASSAAHHHHHHGWRPPVFHRARVCYFGDHIHGDVLPALTDAHWHAVAVVEELECWQPPFHLLAERRAAAGDATAAAHAGFDRSGVVDLSASLAAAGYEDIAEDNFTADYAAGCQWGNVWRADDDAATVAGPVRRSDVATRLALASAVCTDIEAALLHAFPGM